MNTCKTCKWWGSRAYFPGYGDCNHFILSAVGDADFRSDGFLGYGISGGYAADEDYFSTGPDFGCIHWMEKEKE